MPVLKLSLLADTTKLGGMMVLGHRTFWLVFSKPWKPSFFQTSFQALLISFKPNWLWWHLAKNMWHQSVITSWTYKS